MLCCPPLLHMQLDVPSSPLNVFWYNNFNNNHTHKEKKHARHNYINVQISKTKASKNYVHCFLQRVVMIELLLSTKLCEVGNMVK